MQGEKTQSRFLIAAKIVLEIREKSPYKTPKRFGSCARSHLNRRWCRLFVSCGPT